MTKELKYWTDFDFTLLKQVAVMKRRAKGHRRKTLNNIIIAADTETSKKRISKENHIVCWSIAFKFDKDIHVLYGRKPSEFCRCINKMQDNLQGEETLVYFHNLSYDYTFLRRFMFLYNGYPISQLATRPHYPINIEFENGICFRDSAILAQCTLEKWAKDLDVEHKKAVGFWDYEKQRNQDTELSHDELIYITNDVIALVECIDAYLKGLKKSLLTIPYTATGIIRKEVQELGNNNKAHFKFQQIAPDLETQKMLEQVYHGGFTHGNRYYITDKIEQRTLTGDIICYDFASSYPYSLLVERYPMEPFKDVGMMKFEDALELADEYAIMGRLVLTNICVKEGEELPIIQWSKCDKVEGGVGDNGRILAADLVIITTHEQRFKTISEQYNIGSAILTDVKISRKNYLPRWLRDYIFNLFIEKTKLKGGDPVQYAIAKSRINSVYGLHVQKPVHLDITEDYETGDYSKEKQDEIDAEDMQERYDKYLNKWGSVLPYQWGVWCTAYGERHLIELSRCTDDFIYSDTDSVFGREWNDEKLNAYNEQIKQKVIKAGYGPVFHNGRDYWIGIAEFDDDKGIMTEFRYTGAKRYCYRSNNDGKLHTTVAGVPKTKGAECLKDDIRKFAPGFKFKGVDTEKKQHEYHFVDEIYIDEDGNETGDSINLEPCDYKLDNATIDDLESFIEHLTGQEFYSYEYSDD